MLETILDKIFAKKLGSEKTLKGQEIFGMCFLLVFQRLC